MGKPEKVWLLRFCELDGVVDMHEFPSLDEAVKYVWYVSDDGSRAEAEGREDNARASIESMDSDWYDGRALWMRVPVGWTPALVKHKKPK